MVTIVQNTGLRGVLRVGQLYIRRIPLLIVFVSIALFLYIPTYILEGGRKSKKFLNDPIMITKEADRQPIKESASETLSLTTMNSFKDILRNHTDSKAIGFCPCCGYAGELLDYYHPDVKRTRSNAECPVCGARERHRLACFGLAFEITPSTRRILHFGPQVKMQLQLDDIKSIDQISMDFFQETKRGTYKYSATTVFGDVTNIQLPDEFVDLIIILHVLEHVPNIQRALGELNRVLKPKGSMIVEVPCSPSLADNIFCGFNSTAEERIKCGGQNDHYWRYSCRNFFNLVNNASFSCAPIVCSERDLLGMVSTHDGSYIHSLIDAHGSSSVLALQTICQQIHHKGVQAICHKS